MLRRLTMLLALPAALAAQNFDSVQVKAQLLRNGVYMLTGSGGNIGLSVGPDGAFIIDDQFAPLSTKILAAIKAITPLPVKFVVNTHWHFDHTGGNENMGRAGAMLVAHDNVRKRMSTDQFLEFMKRAEKAAPAIALPVVTFTESITFHINGDDLEAVHVPPAHTDGDAIVHFARANVIHMGDTYVRYGYPLVDLSSGGNVGGMVTAADRALSFCNADTKVIPGHGEVADCATLKSYRDMIATIVERVSAAMRAGKSLDAIKASKPTAEFDAKLGGTFVSPDQFVEFTYRSLGGK
jgi:glyoxylase-like metal-dependent hydrolase (beta-lactamase superfamily II)